MELTQTAAPTQPSRASAAVIITQAHMVPPDVPPDVLARLLYDHCAAPKARLVSYSSVPLTHEGTNDSTRFFRVTLTWTHTGSTPDRQTSTWILKHWQAGGQRDRTLGITQSREVLAWEQGWLRPAALPPGLIVPWLGVWRSPDQQEAWLAMLDVSTELAAYPRIGLSAQQAISRTAAILTQLARFHAYWEAPQRQATLTTHSWLRRPESYLWDMAATYAQALGRAPHAAVPSNASTPSVWDGLSPDLDAFLSARAANERRLWEQLLTDRQPLVEGLAAYPRTLLHNDLDDRNIGLRWSGGAATQAELVLIDWEWLALGPAALDVANLIQRLPVLIMLGAPAGAELPAAVWSSELADSYFTHYRAAGGRLFNAAGWRRAYGLALIVQGLAQMPFMHGSLRRVMGGEIPPPPITGVPEAVVRQHLHASLPIMEQMEQRVIREARRWLGL